MIFPLALLDREVIYAGNAPAHKALLIEFPVLVAVAAKPAAAIIMPFVGKTHRDAVLAEGPDFLDQAVVKLTVYRARFFGHKFDLSGVLHGGLLPGETRLTRAA